jgi:uncharacterized membrane protein YccC
VKSLRELQLLRYAQDHLPETPIVKKDVFWQHVPEAVSALPAAYLPPGPVAFSLKTMLASALALLAAFKLQLDSPQWAAVAVWIVAQPKPSQVWGKGFYRLVGTFIGGAMSIVLIALFAQKPELFILALAIWSGICTALAHLLKNFQSYAAVLAGYTTAIVTIPASSHPLHIFETAVSRCSSNVLGVAAVSIVSSLFCGNATADPPSSAATAPQLRAPFRGALGGGVRTAVAIGLAGAFWIATASATGSGVLLITAIMTGLFSTHPMAHRACSIFIGASVWSGLGAFVCLYYIVQRGETFPLLILGMAVFLVPSGIAMANPKTALFGVGSAILFINQFQPANPMSYDILAFLNNLAGSVAGTAAAGLSFLLIFPSKPNGV